MSTPLSIASKTASGLHTLCISRGLSGGSCFFIKQNNFKLIDRKV